MDNFNAKTNSEHFGEHEKRVSPDNNRALALPRDQDLGPLARIKIGFARNRSAVNYHKEVAQVASQVALYAAENRADVIKTQIDMHCESEKRLLEDKRLEAIAVHDIRLMVRGHEVSSDLYTRYLAAEAEIDKAPWPPEMKERRKAALAERLQAIETRLDENLQSRHHS